MSSTMLAWGVPLAVCVATSVGGCIELGEPIPSDNLGQPAFIGSTAKRQPLPALSVPAHPYLAANGRNGMHGDAWASDTHAAPGPLGRRSSVTSASFSALLGGECATTVFNAAGTLFTVCTDLLSMRLVALAPSTLAVLGTVDLPPRPSGLSLDISTIQSDTSGGAYFHLLAGDRPLIANAARHLQIYSFDGADFHVEKDWDLSPYLPTDAHIVDVVPDWNGLYWVITREGTIGTFDADAQVFYSLDLPGEQVQNSIAVAEDGVYAVSDYALYRFEADAAGHPSFSYRIPYDHGTTKKPGAVNQGSGTTPTLLEDGLVAISDNADAQVHVLVYHRLPGHVGERAICATPVFDAGLGFTENSLIGYKRSLIIENNYGYTGPTSNTWARPGMTRVDVRSDFSGCDVVWTSSEEGMTPVAKLSTDNGLIYTYTRQRVADPNAQVWYFTALDYRTGATVFKVHTGDGQNYNNNYGPITLDAHGVAYAGVFNGLIAVEDH